MGTDWLLPVYGLVVGLLVGLTGMGGGVLMTPLLMLGLGMPASAAVGTDLAYSTLTKLAGAWQHWRQGTVDMRVVRGLAIGSVPATLVAVGLLAWARTGIDADLIDYWLKRGDRRDARRRRGFDAAAGTAGTERGSIWVGWVGATSDGEAGGDRGAGRLRGGADLHR